MRNDEEAFERFKKDGAHERSVWWDVETIVTGAHEVNVALSWSLYTHQNIEATLADQGSFVMEEGQNKSLVHAFLKMLVDDKKFKESTVYAHYGGKYDNRCLLKAANDMKLTIVEVGGGIKMIQGY